MIKHAQATKINVQLYKSQDFFVLIVEDNGIGISQHVISDGIGLRNIYSRAEALNGVFNIENGPDKGSVATVRVPYKKTT